MSLDHTQQQTPDEESQARQLSLTHTRPPLDVPGYELQRFLGSGAYGEVWVGADRNTGRRVAIKFYAHRGGVDWALISREVEKLVFLSADRYVVQLLDVGWDTSPPYYVMEFVEHGSLEDRIRQHGTMAVAPAVDLFREIAIGLLHAHGKGVLHCDLKPANILLDIDQHPRLADFGQARLSHEQTPALGTLFYMAPEQADLQAVPDARWDVYAMGAMLYFMLTGLPPHREEASTTELQSAKDLTARLDKYRQLLRKAPKPNKHRQIRGMDGSLADIIDRCLATDPEARFSNVQGLINALDQRAVVRARRPLHVLGVVGPVLLLFVMVYFGWRGYERAVKNTEDLARQRAIENNRFAARLAAKNVSGEISKYFEIVRDEESRSKLNRFLEPVLQSTWLAAINNPKTPFEELKASIKSFEEDEQRLALGQYLAERLQSYRDSMRTGHGTPQFASMFVTDKYGTMLAVSFYDDIATPTIGRNWAHRSYFSGLPNELPPYEHPRTDVPRIKETHLSAVFKSSTTKKIKVAISTPIWHETEKGDNELIGILVMTMNHGDLQSFHANDLGGDDRSRFAVLVDGRPGPESGTILLHPLFDEVLASGKPVDEELSSLHVPREVLSEQLSKDAGKLYIDPMSEHELGKKYNKRWIAAAAPVALVTGDGANGESSGLIVLVQEDFDAIIKPVYVLGNQLLREGLSGLGVVVVVAAAMWFFVSKFLVQTPTVTN